MASRLLTYDEKQRSKILSFLKDTRVSSIVAEARSQGIDLAIVGTPQTAAHSNECVTAGNMTRGRLISLVGEMKMTSTTLDINPLTLPDLTETFDVICSDRKKIKSTALSLKQCLLPGRKGLGKARFPVWEAEVDTSSFTRTSKIILRSMFCETLPPRCCLEWYASWSSFTPEAGCHDFKTGPKGLDPNRYMKILILFIQVCHTFCGKELVDGGKYVLRPSLDINAPGDRLRQGSSTSSSDFCPDPSRPPRKYFAASRSPHIPLDNVFDFPQDRVDKEVPHRVPDDHQDDFNEEFIPEPVPLVKPRMTRAKGSGTTGARKKKTPPTTSVMSSTTTHTATSSTASTTASSSTRAPTSFPSTRSAGTLAPPAAAPTVAVPLHTHLKPIFNGSPINIGFAQVVVQITLIGEQTEDGEYLLHVSDGSSWIPAHTHPSLALHFHKGHHAFKVFDVIHVTLFSGCYLDNSFYIRKMHKIKGEPLGKVFGMPIHFYTSQSSPSVDHPFTIQRGQDLDDSLSLGSLENWDWSQEMIENLPDSPNNNLTNDISHFSSPSVSENPLPSLATPEHVSGSPNAPTVTPPPPTPPFQYTKRQPWINLDPDLNFF